MVMSDPMAGGRLNDRVFGTPPEPVFNLRTNGMTSSVLDEMMVNLHEDNTKEVANASFHMNLFRGGHLAETVFLICDRFRLKPEAKYLALELFNRFMQRHVRDLYKYVQSSSSTNKKKDWLAIQERVRNQMLLRIVSCCQIASKLRSHYKIITISKARGFITEAGHRYSTDNILQSELRVLKTLDYKVCITSPVIYLETLLEKLGEQDAEFPVKVFHGLGLKLLDVFYMKQTHIYKKLYQVASCEQMPSQDDKLRFSSVEADKMLLAVGIISAAAYISDRTRADMTIIALEQISLIPREDITDFCSTLIETVVDGSAISTDT